LSVTSQKYLDVAVSGSGSYDLDGTIMSYDWTFGDGSIATGMTATHSYALAGTYTITLTVKDNDGLTGSDSKPVTVVAAKPPVAVLSVTSQKYLDVAVSGSGSSDADGTIMSYAWTFGDGSIATGMTATHSYALGGTYTITLKVTDNDGLTGSDSKPVTVVAAKPPVASWSWTQKYLDVAVDGSGSSDADGTIMSYAWTFGDGSIATGMTATHSYALGGTYTITLKVTDNDGLISTASGPVTVVAAIPPVAVLSVTSQKYLDVAVDSAGSYDLDGTIASYAWTFGDGLSAAGPTATHSYALAGTYTITLTVKDNDGLTGSDSKPVTVVAAQPPVARFTPIVSGLNVAVDASASTDADGTIVSFAWTFGDGSSATGATASHSYAAAGTYTVTLTVKDNDGLTGLKSEPVTVSLPPPPVASFTYAVSGMKVDVDASGSSGTGLSYDWTWGDGTTGTGKTATHTYATSMVSGSAISGKAGAPGPPHGLAVSTVDADGEPMNGAIVTVTNVRTGESIIWDETREFWDPTQNTYIMDCSEFTLVVPPATQSWVYGDILHVEATLGTWSGITDAPITNTPAGYDVINVVMYPGVAPTYTVTLLVTDSFGRTDTTSWVVTLSP
jgi:PKD repeat protein